jgi:hypothetical protein
VRRGADGVVRRVPYLVVVAVLSAYVCLAIWALWATVANWRIPPWAVGVLVAVPVLGVATTAPWRRMTRDKFDLAPRRLAEDYLRVIGDDELAPLPMMAIGAGVMLCGAVALPVLVLADGRSLVDAVEAAAFSASMGLLLGASAVIVARYEWADSEKD